MEEKEFETVQEKMSAIANEIFETMLNFPPGSKEWEACSRSGNEAIRIIIESNKVGNDVLIEELKQEFEDKKFEYEKEKQKLEEKNRRIDQILMGSKILVGVLTPVLTGLFISKWKKIDIATEDMCNFNSMSSRTTQKMAENFIRKATEVKL